MIDIRERLLFESILLVNFVLFGLCYAMTNEPKNKDVLFNGGSLFGICLSLFCVVLIDLLFLFLR